MSAGSTRSSGFALPQGYFVGPAGEEHRGAYGAPKRPSSVLLDGVAASGQVPPISDGDRLRMADDLRFWHADAVVLIGGPHEGELYATLAALLGPGRRASDAWVRDVRPPAAGATAEDTTAQLPAAA